MKTEQKLCETWCNEHCKLLKHNWELYSQASYGYMTGYAKFRDTLVAELKKKYAPHTGDYFISIDHMIDILTNHGQDKTEVELTDHQLGPKSTENADVSKD